MALLNETQLVGNMKVSLDPTYVSWTRNRTEKVGGGIATAVSQKYSDTAVGAGEGDEDEEYLIVRIEAFKGGVRSLCRRFKQACRTGKPWRAG